MGARLLLEDGSQTSFDVFRQTIGREKVEEIGSLNYFKAYAAGQAAVIKTYMSEGETALAAERARRAAQECATAINLYLMRLSGAMAIARTIGPLAAFVVGASGKHSGLYALPKISEAAQYLTTLKEVFEGYELAAIHPVPLMPA